MFRKKRDEKLVLAAHSRWIAKLRDISRKVEQRLCLLEKRVTIFEFQLTDYVKSQRELDAKLAELEATVRRLGSKLDALKRGGRK